MIEYTGNTAATYEHLVGYVAEDNIVHDLGEYLEGTDAEYKAEVKLVDREPGFEEDWQQIYVAFESFEDYSNFMGLIGEVPVLKLSNLVYNNNSVNQLDFGE